MKKIRVAAVSYLNTLPLLWGIRRDPVLCAQIELQEAYPAEIAKRLREGSADVGLVPVAALAGLPGASPVGRYGIATQGEVASVAIFCEQPLEDCTRVLLDYQSRTSVQLTRLLLQDYWRLEPEYLTTEPGKDFREEIKDGTAGLVIGDRAFEQRLKSKFTYDLGAAWKAHTGLPFVFARWVSTIPLPASFVDHFDAAMAEGLAHRDGLAASIGYPHYDLRKYYHENISYEIDAACEEGLQRFLSSIEAGTAQAPLAIRK